MPVNLVCESELLEAPGWLMLWKSLGDQKKSQPTLRTASLWYRRVLELVAKDLMRFWLVL